MRVAGMSPSRPQMVPVAKCTGMSNICSMPLVFRCLLLIALIAGPARAERLPLPPLVGNVSGGIKPLVIPGAPALAWEVALDSKGAHERTGEVRLRGPGTDVVLALAVNIETGAGTWSLAKGVLELEAWAGAITRQLGAAAGQDLRITGTLELTGSGTVQEGHLVGEIDFALREATLGSATEGWTLEGIAAGGRFALASDPLAARSVEPFTLAVRTISHPRFGARNLSVNGVLVDRGTFKLTSARLEIAGGTMLVAPTDVTLAPFRILADVTVNRIGLQDVAALVPSAVRSAFGRVDGTAQLGWSEERGIEVGRGHLVLRTDEPAEVTLNPSPGLFTSGLPNLVVKYAVPGLKQAEMGEVPIAADSLDITFSPDADALGRTATVHLTGVPKDEKRKPRISLTTNVRGPLKPFIKLGTEGDLSMSFR